MILDEYGSVVGMVSLENVLEELVGPIQDEFDRETPQVTPLGDDAFEVDAACPLDVLAEECGVEIPETEAETAGGLILDLLGRLATTGDSVDGRRPPPHRPARRADPDPPHPRRTGSTQRHPAPANPRPMPPGLSGRESRPDGVRAERVEIG